MVNLRTRFVALLDNIHPTMFMGLYMLILAWSLMTNRPPAMLLWFNGELQRISGGILGMSPQTWALLLLIFGGFVLSFKPKVEGLLLISWPVLLLGGVGVYYAMAVQDSPTEEVWMLGGYVFVILFVMAASKFNEAENARKVLALKLAQITQEDTPHDERATG